MLLTIWEIWVATKGVHSFRQYRRHAGSLGSLWEARAPQGRRIHPVCTNSVHVVLCPRLSCHSWFPHRPTAVVQFLLAVLYRLGVGCQPGGYLLIKNQHYAIEAGWAEHAGSSDCAKGKQVDSEVKALADSY